MKECLDVFCSLSGQQVSFSKSRVLCSNNITDRVSRSISIAYGSPMTKDLGKYLGVPLIHGRITNRTYNSVIEKVQQRLATWKCDSLSLAGRVTLIKAVTTALPMHIMQFVKLLSEVCRRLYKINKDFLWGHTIERNHIHLIKWNSVCLPKWSGGLGIKTMKDMNQALLAKAAWWVYQDDSGTWCKIIKHKYLNFD